MLTAREFGGLMRRPDWLFQLASEEAVGVARNLFRRYPSEEAEESLGLVERSCLSEGASRMMVDLLGWLLK